MKKIFTLISLSVFTLSVNAQIFWTENFGTDNNCSSSGMLASAYTGTNGAWAISSTGTNAADANKWFVSAEEAGMGVNQCGDGCTNNPSLTNRTLHVGADDGLVPTDPGASYDAGGLCPSIVCVTTNSRAESPIINCTGKSFISLSFNYMENGQATTDNATLWYYNGTTWALVFDLAKTPSSTCSPQGQWTAYTVALPLSASNNSGVKIGFSWTNNDDGIGTDPSFAVDDITLYASPSGINEVNASNVNIYSVDNDNITIKSDNTYKLIAVSDILGNSIRYTQDGNSIALNDHSTGIYFVQVEIEGVRITKKIFLK